MNKFIVVTFGVLFWSYYEMSGGSDFEPGWWLDGAQSASAEQQPEAVARADNSNLLTQVVGPSAANAAPAETTQIKAETASADGAQQARPRVDDLLLTRREVPDEAVRDAAEADGASEEAPTKDIRVVDGNVVNMRVGPGTNYSVLTQLSQGDKVEVLRASEGWLKLRVIESNRIGWMADFLVTASVQ